MPCRWRQYAGESKERFLIFLSWASRRDRGSAAGDPVAVSAHAAEDLLHDAGLSSPNRCRIVFVTSSALRWRLVALRRLTRSKARAIPEAALRNNGREPRTENPPALFSRPFAEVLAAAVDRGHVSVRRAAALVGLPIEGLEELFAVHGVEHVIDL